MNRTLIIADIGANHDCHSEAMFRAIDVAKAAGCDVIKFQWTSDPHLMAQRRGKALEDGYANIYAKYLAWPADAHRLLAEKCAEVGIEYMVTAFLPEDVAVIAPHVKRFKIASFEAEDKELIAAHHLYLRDGTHELILSLGMGAHIYCGGPNIKYLHCISAYPTPIEALNLSALWHDEAEDPRDGFSDHSDPALTWTGALAVAACSGTRRPIIEAHLRLDDTDPANPDYPHAMTPAQFTEYVTNIRFTERALGSGEKKLQDCEIPMSRYRVGAPTHG